MNKEIKKEAEVKETTPQEPVATPAERMPEEPNKKGSGKSVFVIVLVVLGVLAVLGAVIFYLVINFVIDRVEEVQYDFEEEFELVDDAFVFDEDMFYEEEGDWIYDEEGDFFYNEQMVDTYPGINDELTGTDLISDRFPSDEIPLSGGRVISSSYDQWSTVVDISTSCSVTDTYEWYVEALENTDWVITSKNMEDDNALIQFDNGLDYGVEGFREGEVTINTWDWIEYTAITVRERF